MKDLDEIFARLGRSTFRAQFGLSEADKRYVVQRGFGALRAHASRIIDERLVPAEILNDGRQTPWRGHPVFVAQHATATCCRGCLAKWHDIGKGRSLSDLERRYILDVIDRWIRGQVPDSAAGGTERTLFD